MFKDLNFKSLKLIFSVAYDPSCGNFCRFLSEVSMQMHEAEQVAGRIRQSITKVDSTRRLVLRVLENYSEEPDLKQKIETKLGAFKEEFTTVAESVSQQPTSEQTRGLHQIVDNINGRLKILMRHLDKTRALSRKGIHEDHKRNIVQKFEQEGFDAVLAKLETGPLENRRVRFKSTSIWYS